MKRRHLITLFLVTASFMNSRLAGVAFAQEAFAGKQEETGDQPAVFSAQPEESRYDASALDSGTGIKGLHVALLGDQKDIWTSPFRLRFADTQWMVPFGAATAGLLATDSEVSKHISQDPVHIKHFRDVANGGVALMGGAAGGMYLWGAMSHDEHRRETGFLSVEASLDSIVVAEALKYATGRERPYQGDGKGRFLQGGNSFPSLHTIGAWSVAGILTHEYPGPLMKIFAYGLATAVSVSRVESRDHFPSDVLVSTGLGWMIAQHVYRKHHDPEVGGGEWRSIGEIVRGDGGPPSFRGSAYVPLDSWVYGALDRLAAMGYIRTQFANARPWSRLECKSLTEEAAAGVADRGDSEVAQQLVDALQLEFADQPENGAGDSRLKLDVDSVYTRVTVISGRPLTDAFHFGETITNDFGRPYQQGFNNVTGFSAQATSGRYVLYLRGEYQHAPGGPADTLAMRQAIAAADLNPVQPAIAQAPVDRFDVLEGYVGVNLSNWQLTVGKQTLWWGPEEGGPLLFSNNAEAIPMFRVTRAEPLRLPSFLRFLGLLKTEAFFGQLSGHQFPSGTILMHGEKITLKPTPNLELGFSRTTIFGGDGRPLTLGAFLNSYIGYVSSVNYSASANPGKRTGGFDLSYRVPFVRDWLSVYVDSLSTDDPNPIDAPRRAAVYTGMYLARVPGIPKLDFRFEGGYTDTSTSRSIGGKFIYWELFYHDVYTNDHGLMGSWIGREGQGFRSWARYSFSPRKTFQLEFRRQRVDHDFIPGGGSVTDVGARTDYWMRNTIGLSVGVQYERWLFPVIAPAATKNLVTTVQVMFAPSKFLQRRSRESAWQEGTP